MLVPVRTFLVRAHLLETGMETLFTFWDIDDARMARTLLEAHNIRVVIPDEFMVQANWGMLYAIGGVRLQVPAASVERARELFEREREPSDPECSVARCHKCGADQLEPAALSRSWALALLAVLYLPIPFRSGYVCLHCKQRQQGTELPDLERAEGDGLRNPYDPPQSTPVHDHGDDHDHDYGNDHDHDNDDESGPDRSESL